MFNLFYNKAFYLLIFIFFISGCAGYAGKVSEMRTALSVGDKETAIKKVNEALKVKEDDQYPDKLNSEKTLLINERGTIKQSVDNFQSSALDFRVADQNMELTDIKNNTVGSISKWIFSGSAGVYRAPPYEKMLLSTLNMLNYLSLGNLEDARVEARRLDITEHTLADENKENDKALLGIGDYLSGFTFEMSGRYEQALQKYAEASQNNNYLSLNKLIPQLASCTSYRDELIDSIIAANPQSVEDGANPGCSAGSDKTGSLLVVTSSGLAPYKRANRLPIGAAVVLAGAFLTPVQLNQANDFAVKGLLKWVNFPELVQSSPQFTKVSVSVDGTPVNIELGENVSLLVKSYWEQIKGKLIAAAIVRMIARAVAGAGTNQAIKSASGDSGLGLLAQVLVEGAMTVADTPDTRTWNTLPAAFFISRVELPPGEHNIKIDFFGNGKTISVNKRIKITSGGFTVIPVHTMR